MKVILSFMGLLLSFSVFADNSDACQHKEREITRQISYAQHYGNTQEVAGLNTALEEVRINCTGENLAREKARKVEDKKRKVVERQHSLAEAQADGRVRNISKAQRKLAEAQDELREAQER